MSAAVLPSPVVELDRSPPFLAAQRWLSRAEAEIALIDRTQPVNAAAERAALLADFERGQPRAPQFSYAPRPVLTELRAALDVLARSLEGEGPLGCAYADRARELAAEAAAAEAIDTAEFAERAEQRYVPGAAEDVLVAETWVSTWLGSTLEEVPASSQHRSDDRADPESLLRALERAAGGLPLRIEVRPNQIAAASVGEGFIAIRAGVMHGRAAVRRIVLHELSGHAEPRLRARSQQIGLFRVGSAQSSEDEEGRALLLERRAGLLDGARARELARRHFAARCVRQGAPFVDSVTALCAQGQPQKEAVEAACRAYRGAGLAREIVYLPALSRVSRAFEQEPALERYLECGRLSVAAARLCARGFAP